MRAGHKFIFALVPLCSMLLVGCSRDCPEARVASATPATAAASEPASVPAAAPSREAESGGEIRQTPSTTPPSPAGVIATRPAVAGVEVDLTRIAVIGDLMTVELRFRNLTQEGKSLTIPISRVSFIDDATSRRYGVVEDLDGHWMASEGIGRWSSVTIKPGSYTSEWLKFPAPPPEMKSLSLVIPEVSPFDGIPMPR